MNNKPTTLSATERSLQEYQRRIGIAQRFIEKHIDDDITPADVADAALFSRFHFYRIFRALCGESVAAYMRRLRLERAANWLVNHPSKDITGIALDSGFASVQSFDKAFQKQFACSPTELRLNPKNSKIGHLIGKSGHVITALQSDNGVRGFNNIEEKPMKVKICDLADVEVCFLRRYGAYGQEIGVLFNRLFEWAGPKWSTGEIRAVAAYWHDPATTPADECCSDACITLPEKVEIPSGFSSQTLEGGVYAVYRRQVRHDGDHNGFQKAWMAMIGHWLPTSGFEPDDKPGYEIYRNNAVGGESEFWDVEFCLPVKPL